MENPQIQELRDALKFSADHRSENHPGAEAAVITSQASVRAALDELDLLRATPGGATEIHILDNGSHVTGQRAAELLDHEMNSHKVTRAELANTLQAYRDLEFTTKQLVEENQKLRARVG